MVQPSTFVRVRGRYCRQIRLAFLIAPWCLFSCGREIPEQAESTPDSGIGSSDAEHDLPAGEWGGHSDGFDIATPGSDRRTSFQPEGEGFASETTTYRVIVGRRGAIRILQHGDH